jgi:hypothetical protein
MRVRLLALTVLLAALPATARAALVYDKGRTTGKPSVWIANDDGTAARRLASNADLPRISPDGQTVVYEELSSKPRLMKVPAAGGTPTALLTHSWAFDAFAWSPDSSMIAAVTGPEIGHRHLVLVNVATGVRRTVMSGDFIGACFAPGGDRVVFGRAPNDNFPYRSEIYTAPVAGGAPTPVTRGAVSMSPVCGPSSVALARQHKTGRRDDAPKSDVYTVGYDGAGLRRLTRTHVPFLLTGPMPTGFSDDGTRLLAEYTGQDTTYGETVNPATGKARRVGRISDGIIGFRLSRDGSTILGTDGGNDESPRHDVVTIRYSGGRPTVLVKRAFDPDWNR